MQSMSPHPTSWRPIWILSTHLTPGFYKWSLSPRFPHQNPVYIILSPIHATCPAYLILLDSISRAILGEEYRSLSSSLYSSRPCYLIPLRPKYSLSILFSDTLSPRSSLNVSDQASHPYKTTDKIIVLYIFIFLDSKLEDKIFCTEWYEAFPAFNLFLISFWTEFLNALGLFQNTWNLPPSQRNCYKTLYGECIQHSDLKTWPCTSLISIYF